MKNFFKFLFNIAATAICASVLLMGTALAAKALQKGDLGKQDFYDMFAAVYSDSQAVKNAVDEGNNDGLTSVTSLATLVNDVKAKTNSLAALVNTMKGTVNSTAGLVNTMVGTVNSTAALVNETAVDHADFRAWMVNMTAIYNTHIANTIGQGVHNGWTPDAGAYSTNTIPATLTATVVSNITTAKISNIITADVNNSTTADVTPHTLTNSVGTLSGTVP